MPTAKKLIEVSLPLEAINVASAREKSIRHGHPSTLHLWWARRPLAAARAVIFTSIVEDPDDMNARPAFIEACRALPKGANVVAHGDTPRMRLFDFIETLVKWESTTDETILNTARELILLSTDGNPPPLLDPFAGGGSIPLEAQRLGLEAHASDLNPVAVMINKAQIEIPPRFANLPPVHPNAALIETTNKKKKRVADTTYRGASGLAADVRYYGEWMRQQAWERIGHLYPKYSPTTPTLALPQNEGGNFTPTLAPTLNPSPKVREGLDSSSLPSSWGKGSGDGGALTQHDEGETVIAWLWARTVKSPNPAVNAHVPLVRSFVLSKKKGNECWAKPVFTPTLALPQSEGGNFTPTLAQAQHEGGNFTPTLNPSPKMREGLDSSPLPSSWGKGSGDGGGTVTFEIVKGTPPKEYADGTVGRKLGGGRCLVSGVPFSFDYVKAEGNAGRMGAVLMAVVTEGARGRNYHHPTAYQVQVAESAQPEWKPMGEMPEQALGFVAQLYGLNEYNKLFTPRQLVALTTFSDLVVEARQQVYHDAIRAGMADDDLPLREGGRGARAYAEAVSVYLAFAVDRCVMGNNTLTRWNSVGCKAQHAFGRQALPMIWDYAEVNPFTESTGSLTSGYKYAADPLELRGIDPTRAGFTIQQDATQITSPAITLSTDPPYYDNIGYADLSDFFYVWLRKPLEAIYPDLFSTLLVPKAAELIASPYRHGGKEGAKQHFEQGMLQAFQNIRRFVSHDYPLTVYYAFKQQEGEETDSHDEDDPTLISGAGERHASTGWETMLSAIVQSGFTMLHTYPMRTELANRMRGMASNALASSIVLVLRPRPTDAPTCSRRQFLDGLRRELPNALRELQRGSIAPVDLAQASIGPGMAIYSRYSAVKEADGRVMGVRTALGLINHALDEYLAEQEGDLDVDTRFAVAWFERFGFNEGAFGEADVLARAKNTSVEGVERAGVVRAERGKVRLIHWSEYDPANASAKSAGATATEWDPRTDTRLTVWEATHHLIEQLHHHGEAGSAKVLGRLPSQVAEEARQLAYRLYNLCERKGWAKDAYDYNALVVSWTGIGEVSAKLRDDLQRGASTEQMSYFKDNDL